MDKTIDKDTSIKSSDSKPKVVSASTKGIDNNKGEKKCKKKRMDKKILILRICLITIIFMIMIILVKFNVYSNDLSDTFKNLPLK
jgi:t-SNARE complex subunit (syntaxin)